MEDIIDYDRFFIAEIMERNGDMEYQDKSTFCVPAGDSLQRTTEEFHLNWRNNIDENWEKMFDTWDEYYASEVDPSQDGAYWSDYTLVNYPSVEEISEADAKTKDAIEGTNFSNRCNYGDMYATAELYIAEAAKFLAREQSIPLEIGRAHV